MVSASAVERSMDDAIRDLVRTGRVNGNYSVFLCGTVLSPGLADSLMGAGGEVGDWLHGRLVEISTWVGVKPTGDDSDRMYPSVVRRLESKWRSLETFRIFDVRAAADNPRVTEIAIHGGSDIEHDDSDSTYVVQRVQCFPGAPLPLTVPVKIFAQRGRDPDSGRPGGKWVLMHPSEY